MVILFTLLACLAVIPNYIELTSQSNRLPDDSSNHDLPESGSSASSPRRLEPPFSDDSKSPNLRQTFPIILGFKFEELAFIRLIPRNYPHRIFELRTYIFPSDKRIRLRTTGRALIPMPSGEQIALSTANGDIYALLEKTPQRKTILRGIFTPVSGESKRAKINTNRGAVKALTAEEIAECPVSSHEPIIKSYGVLRLSAESKCLPDGDPNHCEPSSSARSPPPIEPPLRDRSRSPTLRQTFPVVLGFSFEDLAFIRLVPPNNQNRIFELHKYVFPLDKPIRLRTRTRVLNPIPTKEQLVLSTPNGDVYAILERTRSKHTILRAIFSPVFGMPQRAKINMNTGAVEELTAEEIAECPVSTKQPLTKMFNVFLV